MQKILVIKNKCLHLQSRCKITAYKATGRAGSWIKRQNEMKTYKVIEKATGRDITKGFEGDLPFFRIGVIGGRCHVFTDRGEDITAKIAFVKC